MKTIIECPVCKSSNLSPFLNCKDYTVSKETFNIVNCNSCDFKFTNPRPDDEELYKYYKSEDYISHSNTNKGIISKLYKAVRSYSLSHKIKLINIFVARGTILDYGCGTGAFLKACKNDGWKSYGMEPDLGARELAREKEIPVLSNKEELKNHLGETKLEVITLWHVLEHVTDLEETLAFFKEHLKPNGTILIAVPNFKSYDATQYKEYWAAYDLPRHLYHFDINSIQKLMSSFGFKIYKTKAMKFDSFYVSMLSEKYKTGSINYIKAFWMGLKSNLMAKEAEDYSSVIYIFRKL